MDYILQGFKEAISLIIRLDPEVFEIVFMSLLVSTSATILASSFLIPIGVYLGIKKFKGKRMVSRIIYTSMSIPTVIVGLVVAIILSRRGPLGYLD